MQGPMLLNQRLSGKNNPTQISYFSGYYSVKKKGCLSDLHLSGLTLHSQSWPSLTSVSRKLQIRHGQRRLQPTKVQPILSLPPEQQEYFKARHSWGPSNILVESSQTMQWKLEPAAPLPCKLNFTKPQRGHLITLSWINKNSWAVLVSHGEADLWTNHKPCLSVFQDPFPLH